MIQFIRNYTHKWEGKPQIKEYEQIYIGYFNVPSPPFLHNSPTQKAAFLLLVASDDPSSLSTKGISLWNMGETFKKRSICHWNHFTNQILFSKKFKLSQKNYINIACNWSTHVLSNFGKACNHHCPILWRAWRFLRMPIVKLVKLRKP